MAKLIITADDFGLNRAVNEGIIDCVKEGVITSVHVMMNMVDLDDLKKLIQAVDYAKEYLDLDCGIGLHFNTTAGNAMLNNPASSLVETENKFYSIRTIKYSAIKLRDLQLEFQAQLDALANELGGYHKIDAISSHHNFHFFDACFLNIMLAASKRYKIPYRSPVQWRTGGQIPDPPKYKTSLVLPVGKDGIFTWIEASHPTTRGILINALRNNILFNQRDRIILSESQSPVNSSGQWYGQPSFDCIKWIVATMNNLQGQFLIKKLGKLPDPDIDYSALNLGMDYISEIYTHIANSEGRKQQELTYSMSNRLVEYYTWKTFKVKKFIAACNRGEHGIELCSYRSAFENYTEKTNFEFTEKDTECLEKLIKEG